MPDALARAFDDAEIRVTNHTGISEQSQQETRAYYDEQIAALNRRTAAGQVKTPRLDAAARYLAVIEDYDATMKK
jgi:hypothetical protein